MATELVFRYIFVACLVAFAGGIVPMRLRARGRSHGSLLLRLRNNSGQFALLLLFAALWWAGIILYTVYPSLIAFLSIPLPAWFRVSMIALIALSIPLVMWSHCALGKNWVHAFDPAIFKERKEQFLVTDGPYRYVRNPIYFASIMFVIALALLAANWFLLISAFFLVAMFYRQISKEEAMLLERFGNEYRQYVQRTPRLVPRFR